MGDLSRLQGWGWVELGMGICPKKIGLVVGGGEGEMMYRHNFVSGC
jgi:hypothetical protein